MNKIQYAKHEAGHAMAERLLFMPIGHLRASEAGGSCGIPGGWANPADLLQVYMAGHATDTDCGNFDPARFKPPA